MVAESPSSIKNEVVGGRYRLGDVIGRGGMSSVYCARDENLGRDVALKLFAPQAPDAEELKRQEAEIQLLATLNHPGLVTLFDAGIDDRIPDEPRPFLTMELVEGQDLRARIRHSRVPLEELSVIGAGIADALAYVHGLGIIHRDIKPGNILLVQIRPGEPLRPKLTDFGIARIVDSTRLTATGTMVGTAAYLSPEQALGKPLSSATDIYSFGLVLLECIKGTVEYPGSAVESAVARLHRAPEIPDDVPSEWADLIRSMTTIEPLERPSAADIETALRQALVSPASTPGELAPETTRVLPAMPFHPPTITAEESVDEVREAAEATGAMASGSSDDPSAQAPATASDPVPESDPVRQSGSGTAAAPSPAKASGKPRLSRNQRIWLAVVLAALVIAAAAAAVLMSITARPADVVPYPTVTGVLGDHLQELQKSVAP
ncbi:serine/threonine-protein kinase [Pseudarthrobacter sp. LT1]|uniref:serine/threonine-protein kinase n=1 Tax=Pseudarthrobacter sp. LT1 TaxID=3111450 RepID=UPI002D7904DE|nr:serine/threonine-protein kinase [Pseudarthrobacter sp. LT1]WRT15089.1 serine/threonine-protein kinase [Pseudarthrobacter sp. LT1]